MVVLRVMIIALDNCEEEATGNLFEDADHSIRGQVDRLLLLDPLLDVLLDEQICIETDGGETWVTT